MSRQKPLNRHGRRPMLASSSSEEEQQEEENNEPAFDEWELIYGPMAGFTCNTCNREYRGWHTPGHFDSRAEQTYTPTLLLSSPSCCIRFLRDHIDKNVAEIRTVEGGKRAAEKAAKERQEAEEAKRQQSKVEQANNIAAKQAVREVKLLMDFILQCEDAESVKVEAARYPHLSSRAAVAVWRDWKKKGKVQ